MSLVVMRNGRFGLGAMAIALAGFGGTVLGAEQSISLSHVGVRLFLENTGRLSADVTEVDEFLAWNFRPHGAGFNDSDRFASFVVVVEFESERETYRSGEIASVRITKKMSGDLVLEKEISNLYIGPAGRAYVPVYVEGHICDSLTVQVTSGAQNITHELPFHCGE